MFYSQADQDKWVCEILNYKKNGIFVDIGAYDGIQTSNSYYLEKELGWKGICIEPNIRAYNSLILNRSSINLNVALSDYNGQCLFQEDKITSNTGNSTICKTLQTVLEENFISTQIDYLSIDVEGHEYIILKDFSFQKWEIKLITLEHNLYMDGPSNKDKLYKLMSANGFDRVVEDARCLDPDPRWYGKPYEDWYVNNNYSEIFKETIENWMGN